MGVDSRHTTGTVDDLDRPERDDAPGLKDEERHFGAADVRRAFRRDNAAPSLTVGTGGGG
jgi:hypothetical protein